MTCSKIYSMITPCIVLKRSSYFTIKRWYCQEALEVRMNHFIRCGVQIDPTVENVVDKSKYRKHPGRRNTTPVELPERFVKAAFKIYKSLDLKHKDVMTEALSFSQHISRRMIPPSDREIRNKGQEVLDRIVEKDDTDIEELSEEARESLEQSRKDQMLHKLKTKIYNWQPIDYNEHICLLYLLGCFSKNYATLTKIFCEIKKSVPDFRPVTFLDFGSGTGSGIWAANECFDSSVSEVLCVDASGEMNQLNQLVLQDGDPEGELWQKNMFFKRHLPPSNLIKYDLVLSAHTLLDLPTSKERIQVINNLWNKTQDMLVIVEHGTFAGHSIVIEARDYILDKAKDQPKLSPAYVIAPCQHDLPCPKSLGATKRPCSFPVKYHPLSFHKRQNPNLEKYSYIVISKKKHKEDSQWPRLISPVMNRSNHVICRMCNTDGKLYESIVTKYTCGKHMYQIAKASKWGDLLPACVEKTETPLPDHSPIDEDLSEEEDNESDSDSDHDSDQRANN